MPRNQGYSLVELLVVIVILGILLGIASLGYGRLVDVAQELVDRITGGAFNGVFEVGMIVSATGLDRDDNENYIRTQYISVTPNTTYVLTGTENIASGNRFSIFFYDDEKNYRGIEDRRSYYHDDPPNSFTTNPNTSFIRIRAMIDDDTKNKPGDLGPFFTDVRVK